jgi:hypothetical protein
MGFYFWEIIYLANKNIFNKTDDPVSKNGKSLYRLDF